MERPSYQIGKYFQKQKQRQLIETIMKRQLQIFDDTRRGKGLEGLTLKEKFKQGLL